MVVQVDRPGALEVVGGAVATITSAATAAAIITITGLVSAAELEVVSAGVATEAVAHPDYVSYQIICQSRRRHFGNRHRRCHYRRNPISSRPRHCHRHRCLRLIRHVRDQAESLGSSSRCTTIFITRFSSSCCNSTNRLSRPPQATTTITCRRTTSSC